MATLGDLIIETRQRADDTVYPYRTDETMLARWASEAEREACVAARLLFEDGVMDGVTTIAVTPDTHSYAIDPLVHWIDAATFTREGSSRAEELVLTGLDWIREQPCWMTRTAYCPEALADNGRDRLRLYPIPAAAGTLQLAVYRFPLYAMEEADDEPEIREEHHLGLVDWMLFRYWSQKDGEQYDPKRAAQAKADFEERFGERPTAGVMRRHRERRRITTRYGGIR